MFNPKKINNNPTITKTIGVLKTVPKIFPVKLATIPNTEYVTEIPKTYINETRNALHRDPVFCPPIKLIVTGINGYIHGVKETNSPEKYATGIIKIFPELRYCSINFFY